MLEDYTSEYIYIYLSGLVHSSLPVLCSSLSTQFYL